MFPSAATAFQAARTCDKQVRLAISEVEDYDELVRIVRSIKNPPDWAKNRYKVMEKIVRDKFKRNRPIADKLVATKDRELVNSFLEGADSELYWGVVNGTGQNNLGKILMGVRDDIIRLNDSEKWLLDQNCETDPSLFPEVDLVVQKEDKNIDKLFLEKRNCFLFGSEAKNSFRLEHPSISKFHAGIYFSTDLEVVLVDLNSTHGTKVVRDGKSIALEALKPFALAKADVLIFGMSSRRYLVNINTEKV